MLNGAKCLFDWQQKDIIAIEIETDDLNCTIGNEFLKLEVFKNSAIKYQEGIAFLTYLSSKFRDESNKDTLKTSTSYML